jgi:hypothetical protein
MKIGRRPDQETERISMSRVKLRDLTRTRKWAHQKLIEKGSGVYLEAVEVGIEMEGGPATVSARLALQVMKEVYKKRF